MTDTDLLRGRGRRIDGWLRYVDEPNAPPRQADEPFDPRWVALHADLRALEQRCTDEGWPAALRDRLREVRRRLRGRRLIEDRNPQGRILACRSCGGGMTITELFVVNHKDPEHMSVDIFPERGPGQPMRWGGDRHHLGNAERPG
jgi:hypothetical protein